MPVQLHYLNPGPLETTTTVDKAGSQRPLKEDYGSLQKQDFFRIRKSLAGNIVEVNNMTDMNRLYDGAICWTGGRRAALRFETKTGFRKAPEGVAFTNPTSKGKGLIPPIQQLNYRGPIIMGDTTDTSIMMLSMSLSLNVRMADTESPVLETSPTEIQYVGDGLVRVGRTIPEMITGEEEFVLLLSKDRTIWSRVANMTLVQAKNRWNPYTVFSVADMGQTDRLSRLQTDYARVLTHKKAFLRPGYLRDRSIVVRINTNFQALDVFDERIQLTNARISDGMLYADNVYEIPETGEIALGTGWAQQFVGYRRLKDGLLRLSTVSHIVNGTSVEAYREACWLLMQITDGLLEEHRGSPLRVRRPSSYVRERL